MDVKYMYQNLKPIYSAIFQNLVFVASWLWRGGSATRSTFLSFSSWKGMLSPLILAATFLKEPTIAVILSYIVVATPFSWSWCRCFALANHVTVWKLRLCPSLCVTLLVSIPLRRRTSHRFQTTVSIRHLSCVPFFSSSSYDQGNWRTYCYCKCFDFPRIMSGFWRELVYDKVWNLLGLTAHGNCSSGS